MKIIKTYNLVNPKGNTLQLRLGHTDSPDSRNPKDHGWRWSFIGQRIPMPIRSGEWFNGFPENTMLDWLAENDWHVRSIVNMTTGRTKVYELPDAPWEYPDDLLDEDTKAFNKIICDLVSQGRTRVATQLFRLCYEVDTDAARAGITCIYADRQSADWISAR